MSKLKKIFLHPVTIAFLIILPAGLIWQNSIMPLKMEIIKDVSTKRYLELFDDTDTDGDIELLEFWSKPSLYFVVENSNESIKYSISVHGTEYIGQNRNVLHDCNGDDYKELFVFTYIKDTIFLNTFSLYNDKQKVVDSHAVTIVDRFNILNELPDCRINQIWFNDFNNDGFDEAIFTAMAGFTVSPRRIYIYDIKNDSLKKSLDLGCKGKITDICDIDNDDIDEILLGTGDVNNCSDTCKLPFPDTCAYFLAFDENLKTKYQTVRSDLNRAFASIIKLDKSSNLLAWAYSSYPNSTTYSTIEIKNDSMIIGEPSFYEKFIIPVQDMGLKDVKNIFLNGDENMFLSFDEDNKLTESFELKYDIMHGLLQNRYYDFDNDNYNDAFFTTRSNQIILISLADKKTLAVIEDVNLGNDGERLISVKPVDDYWIINLHLYFSKNTLIKLSKNHLYKWRWGIVFAAFIILSLVFIGIDMFFKYRLKKSLEIRHKLQELQLLNTKSQISPHFLFNALNSISSLIYKEDKEKAYDFITRFSKLHRSLLENSDQVFISLHDELEFLENYLVLQKLRYKERLEYEILCNENVNTQINVPKMLIQGYVENAIKHGISARNEGGKVSIIVNQNNNLQIIIEDNGIGMHAASKVKNRVDSTGKGLRINRQIFDLLEDLYKYKVKLSIENLNNIDTGETGTRIILELPVK